MNIPGSSMGNMGNPVGVPMLPYPTGFSYPYPMPYYSPPPMSPSYINNANFTQSLNSKELFIKKLDPFFMTNEKLINYQFIKEQSYEWDINDWKNMKNDDKSSEFTLDNYKWKIILSPNNNNNENDNVFLFLENQDVLNDYSLHICTNTVFYIRNKNDDSVFYAKEQDSLDYYSKNFSSWGFMDFIKKSELFSMRKGSNKSLVENNQVIIGVDVRFYEKKDKKEQYYDELKKLIEESDKPAKEGFYEWKIDNWYNVNNFIYSPEFVAGGYR
eukprot:jgi/Orpsp1_1/1184171/evm.model.c7180000088298.1